MAHTHEFERRMDDGPGVVMVCECGETTTARGAIEYEAFHGDPCEGFAGLMVNRATNTGGGRPSDGARYVVRLHASIGCAAFREQYERGAGSHRTLEEAAGSLGLTPGGLA